ncbi:MAG: exodeoxyribonuclease V subunit beta, partial [Methylovulum sp.]|nr:exodeoxyribonuclease V subunit beta [Methylovulum sp.]
FPQLYALFQQPDSLLKQIQALLKSADPIPDCLAADQDIKTLLTVVCSTKQASLDALKQPWGTWTGEVKSLVETAVKNKVLPAQNYRSDYVRGWFEKIDAWRIDPAQETPDMGKGFDNLSPDGMANLAKDGKMPPEHPGFNAIARLKGQLAALPNLRAELIKHAIHWIRARYDSEKQRIARMTFDDMLTRLDKALQGSNGQRLASAIRQQHPVALIDEFQDTDPIQYRIFSMLYRADADSGLGCFMIGDPKQAIYSFRGADIYTYLKAYQDTKGRHYTLDTNYRSTTDLVAAVNQAFLQADQQAGGAFRFRSETDDPLPFSAVKAQGRKDDWVIGDKPAPALTLWHWQTPEAISQSEYRATMAEVAASEIVNLLNSANVGHTGFKSATGIQPLQPSDIAILVRTGKEAKAMRHALAKRRTRSVYLSERDPVFASPEAADLLLWLKAFAEPRNERKVRTALSTGTFGWPYQTLKGLALDETAWEQQLERFLGYQQRWLQDGILPTLRQLINDYGLHARLIEDNDGGRCITNLLHLAELLQQASTQLEGEQALIRYLAEAIEGKNGSSGDENIVRLESDANLIKIITIHKSKGLEYPLVFLPFICSFREVTRQHSTYYRYHDENQELHIDLEKEETFRVLNDGERLQEDMRLLYVAMTRARYACWLGIAPVKSGNTKACQLEKSGMGSLLGWQAGMKADDLGQQLGQLKGDCNAIAVAGLPHISTAPYQAPQATGHVAAALTATPNITDNWWIASYSALAIADQQMIQGDQAQLRQEPETASDDKHGDEAELGTGAEAKPQTGIHGLPRGAEPGVLIHDLLEHCAYLGFANVQAQPKLGLDLIQKRFSANVWAQKQDIIASALSNWLVMPLLHGADINLARLNEGGYQAELEFLIGADHVAVPTLDRLVTQHTFQGQARPGLLPQQVNGLLKGFIDLVFVHDQQYYVVDYKFNSLGKNDADYTPEALAAAMLAKRYDVQCSLYLLALHRLLKIRLGADYDYDRHIGGGLYLFLRGFQGPTGGRVFDKPPKTLIDGLDNLFSASARHGETA